MKGASGKSEKIDKLCRGIENDTKCQW